MTIIVDIESKRKYQRDWYNKNKVRLRVKGRKKDRKEYQREYYQKNKDMINKRNMKHNKKRKTYMKKWNRDNPEKRFAAIKRHLEKYGKTFYMNPNEYLYALQSWSIVIKKLDGNVCQICDSKENLNAHHMFYKSKYPQLSLNINNGITLCNPCHSELHGFQIYNGGIL